MADAASLIVRVKTEGAEQSAKQLDALTQSSTKADTAVTKTGAAAEKAAPKMSGFGTKAQQAGYQIQDFVVQVQSGTSIFVAFGQQASQLAGSLGPGGAVLGAVIALGAAVGGVLYKSMGNAKLSAEELEASAKQLDAVLQKNAQGAYELSDSFVTLANKTETASQAQAKFYAAQAATVTQTQGAVEAAAGLVDGLESWYRISATTADSMIDLGQTTVTVSDYVNNLAEKFGLTYGEARSLVPLLADVQKNATPENVKALGDATGRLVDKYGATNSELVQFNKGLFENIGKLAEAKAQADALAGSQGELAGAYNSTTQRLKEQTDQIIRNVQIGNMADKERYAAQAQADKDAFAKREGVTEEQIKAYNAARDEEARQDIQRVIDTENKKAEAEATAASKRAAAETRRAENLAAQQKQQAQTFLDTLARQNSDELAAIDEVERQKLAKLQEFQMQGAISAQQAEDAKTKIMVAAEDARQEELANRRRDAQQKQFEKEQILAEVASLNASELELVEIQEQQKASILQRYRDEGILSEEEYQGALVEIAAEANKRRRDAYATVLGQTTDDLKTALGEGNKAYKAFAIANAIMNTYQGAVAAFQSAAAIPIVGWVAAPIAAAAAVAAGLANVAKIRSAREQGGNLSAGQMSTIAERGQPEVIMPASASRVRTAQQMKQIMGENASSSQPTTVQIVNQTTGRIDSATTERMDEATLRVIIRETVSGDMTDSNSSIAKSRRATRGRAGY
ncbi:MAG: hypothetical protein ACRCXB_06080 [Aeromonadaceae bacterium]